MKSFFQPTKTLIVGILIGVFVVPMVKGKFPSVS